jgi:hypothetical protein
MLLIVENGHIQGILLCRTGIRCWIPQEPDAPTEVVDTTFEDHFTEFQMPTWRTHSEAERALDA